MAPVPYCPSCDRRCYVERIIKHGPWEGWRGLMPTCQIGMERSRDRYGYDYTTALNPADRQRR